MFQVYSFRLRPLASMPPPTLSPSSDPELPSALDSPLISPRKGRGATPENGSVVYPMENTLSGVYCSPYQNMEYRPVQHSLLSARMEGPQFRVAGSGASYDPFLHSTAPGSSYMVPENSAGHAHMNYYNSHTTQEVESALLDPTMGTGRNPFKRKSPDLSLGCETGSTSRFYATGSSSSSSESQPEKSTSDYRHLSSSSIGLPHYRGGNFPFGSEDALRNVRSRSRLDVDPMGRSYISNQSFHHYRPMSHLTSHSGTVGNTNINADVNTHDQNHVTPPPAAHQRLPISETIVINHEMNQFLVGGRNLDTGRLRRDSLPIRNPVSPPLYPSGIHPQIMSEGRGNYSRRAISSYRASPSCSQLGHEAACSENGPQFLSETHSSRYLRPSSARGWCNNHLDGRSRISSERFESVSNAGAHDRMGPEALMMVDHPPIYGSRNLFDQYRDMRLDIDNMSYEELLALGERMGNVSTGLSENFISKCLVETKYSSKLILEEARCAICLEEYKNKEEIGTVNNCGHDYHAVCIKKWLLMKNACPICKAPALSDSLKEQ
ncbi:probable E3 ubiquitin-protein ligase RHG1A isoform X3 [Carya illinoinensis]|uniref:probable E3 ubiquitin-protein ligase RHG1A isoform X3 n=1 Tax=Carya illinoinensis TaxID=32201 RepID=UPI001C71D65D|nr:probable E3 ubiquitin-protein ligase RHG1A isoform X3 [Carya illinoinensis]